VEVYSTANVPRLARAAYWNDLFARRFAAVTMRPSVGEEFEAELRMGRLGPIRMAAVSSTATEIERTSSHIERPTERLFSFLLPLEGRGVFSHYGHEVTLAPGDFTLCDNALPHRLDFLEPTRLLILRTPPELLRRHLPAPEKLCGLRLGADLGVAPAAAALVRSLWEQVQAGLPETFGDRLASHMLDVLATAYAMGFGAEVADASIAASHRVRVKQHVEGRLDDPDLTPPRVARALGISPRYLRMLAAADGESLSGYILRRRLEECAKQISSPMWRGRTLTEAAFGWGFNSASHFTRAFKARFGVTPTAYRELHAPGLAS
jgi:AraC family transcriptional activator of tynA and feaB